MIKMMITFSSVVLLGLGITACSKEGSKKQPNFRNRNKPISQTSANRPAVGPQTGRTDTASGNQKPGQVQSLGQHLTRTNSDGIACMIQKDKTKVDFPCDSVLVAEQSGEVIVLTHTDDSVYTQGTELSLNGKTEVTVEQNIPLRKLKLLQIMKDGASLQLSDELQANTLIIATDEELNELNAKLAQLKTLPDEHLLIVTNVDSLQGTDIGKVTLKRIHENLEQKDLRMGPVEEADKLIADEQLFLQAHIAQLTYSVAVPANQKYSIKVTLDEQELKADEQYTHELASIPNRVLIRILDLSLFAKPNYKISVELTEEN